MMGKKQRASELDGHGQEGACQGETEGKVSWVGAGNAAVSGASKALCLLLWVKQGREK